MVAAIDKLFRKTTWTWWEMGVFKLVLLAWGILLGVYFPTMCLSILPLVVLSATAGSLYIIYVWLKKSYT